MDPMIIFMCFLASIIGGLLSGLVVQSFHKTNLDYINKRLKNHFEFISEAWQRCIEIKKTELLDALKKTEED